MTALERAMLLERAEGYSNKRNFAAVVQLLDQPDTSEALDDPQVAFFLALAWSHTGRDREALLTCGQILENLRRTSSSRLLLRTLNLEGALLMELGNLDAAAVRFEQIIGSRRDINNLRFVAAASMNLSTLEAMRHRWNSAIIDLNRTIGISSSIGLFHQVGGCHHNLGMVYRETGHFHRSAYHFERAKQLLAIWGTREEQVATAYESALMAALSGDLFVAQVKAERAFITTTELGILRLQGEALRVLGIVSYLRGDPELAMVHLRRAYGIAKEEGTTLLRAETAELLGIIIRHQYSDQDAILLANEAEEAYRSMGIPPGRGSIWMNSLRRGKSLEAG